jgi:uncharacterized protein (DUF58 family)
LTVQEFDYRIAWRARGHHPGHHRAAAGGGGFEFHSHAPLLAVSDPRRLDVRASLHDPFGQWLVRVHHQRSAIPVYVIADLSASMAVRAGESKFEVLLDVIASTAYSAWRTGDPFGFVGADERVREEWFLPLTRARAAANALVQRLRAATLGGKNAQGLLEAPRYLGRERGLVLLVSDFHFPLALAEEVAARLAHHDIVPIVLWDPLEDAGPGRGPGLATVYDSETGARRTLVLRAALRARLAENYARHRAALASLFRGFGREPFFLRGPFRADALTEHFFHEGGGN